MDELSQALAASIRERESVPTLQEAGCVQEHIVYIHLFCSLSYDNP